MIFDSVHIKGYFILCDISSSRFLFDDKFLFESIDESNVDVEFKKAIDIALNEYNNLSDYNKNFIDSFKVVYAETDEKGFIDLEKIYREFVIK